MTRAVMIQGTGSNVGKSLLVAGLCRAALRRGLSVAPFKPQNMSNNAAVTRDGGEIGRAQALQALAAGREPVSDMNPVLLKPETDRRAQVVVQGQARTTLPASGYGAMKGTLLPAVLDSFQRLSRDADLIVVEGAGSPAEVNLRARDIANMGFARAAGVPVILAGDIDRGGVIAQLVGTAEILEPADRAMIRGFLVNRFRGDPRLFDDGYSLVAERTGWQGYGVLPWFAGATRLPAEDSLDLAAGGLQGTFRIVCPALSRIANFDDLDPLKLEPSIRLDIVPPGRALPGDADLVLLPGTKSTRGDLAFLRAQGWDIDIHAHVRRGGEVLGICGGYQMLGRQVADPDGIDGEPGVSEGLGLLDVKTVMAPEKRLARMEAQDDLTGERLSGYEIHAGRTEGPDRMRPFVRPGGRDEGARSTDGRIAGTYLHGLFAADGFRRAWLAQRGLTSGLSYGEEVERVLNDLADHMEAHLDVEGILGVAESVA